MTTPVYGGDDHNSNVGRCTRHGCRCAAQTL